MELEEALEQAEVQEEEEELFVIDNELRTITIPSNIQNVGVESDSDVRRLCFQMPKQYGEVDLSAFDVRVNYLNANKEGDVYVVTDKEVSGDHMTFSWLLSRNAMAYKGTIRFIVCLKKTDDEGVTQQEFNTTIAQLTVLEGLETTEKMIQENKDLIEAILKQLDDVSGAEAKRQQAETERASAESERQKQEQERQQAIVQVTNTANEAQNTANQAQTTVTEMEKDVLKLKTEMNSAQTDIQQAQQAVQTADEKAETAQTAAEQAQDTANEAKEAAEAALNELNSKTLMSGQMNAGDEKKFTLKPKHSYLLTFAGIGGAGNAYSDTISVVIIITGASSALASAIKWITPEPEIKKANISFNENDRLELVVTTPAGSWIVLSLYEL